MSNGSIIKDIYQSSVTHDEQAYTKPVNGNVRLLVGYSQGTTSIILKSLPDLPPFWSHERDNLLASTVMESHWAQAVGIAVMKLASRSWDIDGNVPFLRKERARTIIRGYEYIGQVSKGFADYILRGNGWHIEVVRQHTAAGSRVIGLNYLPSSRCHPTGNPEIPVVYLDRLNRWHEMKAHQIVRLVDNPDGNSELGIGMCAAQRAYNDIRNFAAVQQFRLEKVTGMRPQSLYFVTGVTQNQIEQAVLDAKSKKQAEGVIAYGGAVISAFIQRDGIELVEIPLSSLPDDFNMKEEWQIASFSYANALPLVTSLDLMPMTGQRAGTGAQSQVIDDSSIGKEMVLKELTLNFNNEDVWHILPEGTTFYFIRNDLADRQREAEIVNTYVKAAALAVEKIGLEPTKAVDWLSDKDVFPGAWGNADTGNLEASENRTDDGESVESVVRAIPVEAAVTSAAQKEYIAPPSTFNFTMPPITIYPPASPNVTVENHIPAPNVTVQNNVPVPSTTIENHLPSMQPPPVSVYNTLPELSVHVPQANVTVQNTVPAQPAPIVNNILPTPPESTTELSFVRDDEGRIQSPIIKKVR